MAKRGRVGWDYRFSPESHVSKLTWKGLEKIPAIAEAFVSHKEFALNRKFLFVKVLRKSFHHRKRLIQSWLSTPERTFCDTHKKSYSQARFRVLEGWSGRIDTFTKNPGPRWRYRIETTVVVAKSNFAYQKNHPSPFLGYRSEVFYGAQLERDFELSSVCRRGICPNLLRHAPTWLIGSSRHFSIRELATFLWRIETHGIVFFFSILVLCVDCRSNMHKCWSLNSSYSIVVMVNKALMIPQITHGITIWGGCHGKVLHRVRVIRNDAIRAILGVRRYESVRNWYDKLEVLKIGDIHHCILALLAPKLSFFVVFCFHLRRTSHVRLIAGIAIALCSDQWRG